MAKIGLDRKKRNIRRLVLLGLVIIALASYLVYNSFLRDDLPEVRTARLAYGDIVSRMFVTAEIQPGATVQHTINQQQEVIEVLVQPGDQVRAGEVLLRLDMSALEEQYREAVEAREEIEKSLADEEKAAADRAAEVLQAQREVERQLNNLSASLSGAIGQLSQLLYTSPSQLEIDPDLEQVIGDFISGLDPDNPQPDISAFLASLEDSFTVADNPAYDNILRQLENELQSVSSALSFVVSNISGSLDLTSQLGSQISGLSGLEMLVQNPLTQALAREETAKKQLEEAVPEIRAKISGLIGAVNVAAGDLAGPVQLQTGTGLEGLLGGSLSGVNAASASLVTIYDNLHPIAVFQADRYDARRIEEGMKVQHQYDDLVLSGEITSKSRVAERAAFNQSGNLDFFGDVSGISGITSEPQLRVEMSIKGNNLTDLILGFWIEAEIETARAENVLLLPAEAMRREINQYYVYVIGEAGVLVRREFQPGIQSDMFVQVLSGLDEGERVVLNPTTQHYEGLQVREIDNG